MAFRLLRTRSFVINRLFRLDRETWRGPGGRTFERHTLVHPGAVAILARHPSGRLVLVRQFRAAARRALLEIPAGTLEPGEAPLACAKRELIEETGYAARRWKKLGAYFLAPGYSTEQIVLYAAAGLRPAQGQPDEDEYLRVVLLTAAQLRAAIRAGRVCDAKTVCAFFLAEEQNRQRARKKEKGRRKKPR